MSKLLASSASDSVKEPGIVSASDLCIPHSPGHSKPVSASSGNTTKLQPREAACFVNSMIRLEFVVFSPKTVRKLTQPTVTTFSYLEYPAGINFGYLLRMLSTGQCLLRIQFLHPQPPPGLAQWCMWAIPGTPILNKWNNPIGSEAGKHPV